MTSKFNKSNDPGQRKPRFPFSVSKDIALLKALINANPWIYGEDQWKDVVDSFCNHGWKVTVRSLKGRLNTLMENYKLQTLVKTGTEEERTERADLLEEIVKLIDAGQSLQQNIIIDHGAINDLEPSEIIEISNETVDGGSSFENERVEYISKKEMLIERKADDADRDKALLNLKSDEAPEPSGTRRKRSRMLEEDLVQKRQLHDMSLEIRKIELDEDRERRASEDGKRRDDLDETREARLYDEGKRRDELASQLLDIQKQQLNFQKAQMDHQKILLDIMSTIVEK